MAKTISLVENSPFLGKVPRIFCDRANFRLFTPIYSPNYSSLKNQCARPNENFISECARLSGSARHCGRRLEYSNSPIDVPDPRVVHAGVGDHRYCAYRPEWTFFSDLGEYVGRSRKHFQLLEFALDWDVNTHAEADEMLAYAVSHLCIRWRGYGRRKNNKEENDLDKVLIKQASRRGWYFNNRKSHFNVVMYSDRPSRYSGKPCFHMEIRLKNSPLRRLFGNNLCEVTKQEVIKLFSHRLRWVEPKSAEALGRADLGIDGRHRRKLERIGPNIYRNTAARHGSILLRANQGHINETDNEGNRVSFVHVPIHQKILDDMPHLKKAYRALPFESILTLE